MRLGIITGDLAARDGDGRVWIQHGVGRLWDELAQRIPDTRVCLSLLPERQPFMMHPLSLTSERIVALPPLPTTVAAQRHFYPTRRRIRDFAESVDVLFMRLPFQLMRALVNLRKPKVLHVVNNIRQIVRSSSDYRGIWRWLSLAMAYDAEQVMRKLARESHTRVVTNGGEMWNRLAAQHGRTVVSSCIRADEMCAPSQGALHTPPRLLFVGYLRPEKGIFDLIGAFEKLRSTRAMVLSIVGATDNPTSTELRIHQRIAASPYRADFQLLGHVEYGEPLFDLYRSHDLMVLPSLSEGTPRNLIEARAFGCPVVGTRVGGIPASIEHEVDGLLVPPRDPDALAQAIARILDEEFLRQRLIQGGIARAQRHTLESFTDELVEELRLVYDAR